MSYVFPDKFAAHILTFNIHHVFMAYWPLSPLDLSCPWVSIRSVTPYLLITCCDDTAFLVFIGFSWLNFSVCFKSLSGKHWTFKTISCVWGESYYNLETLMHRALLTLLTIHSSSYLLSYQCIQNRLIPS